jgi:hypothetical protein
VSVLCAALLLSCSVKEDRAECPCFLTLDLGEVESAGLMGEGLDSLVVTIGAEEEFYVREAFRLRDNVREYSAAVPKSMVDVLVACVSGPSRFDPYGVHIPEGSECPVLYLYGDTFVADEAEMRHTVSLHRNYCVLSVSMKTSFGARARPYRILLEGNVSGYLMDGTPEEGVFNCFSSPSSDGLCRLRIPRQLDGSLRLEIDFLDSGEVRTFPVGEYILESGYDWTAPDLEDISLEMDFSRSSLTFTISKWKKTLSFEITF